MTVNERASAVRGLRERIAAFRDEQFGPYITEVLSESTRNYPPPTLTPIAGDHPHLLFRRETVPALRAALDRPECAQAAKAYRKLLESPLDGILEPAYLHESGRRGYQNFNDELPSIIKARALAYHIEGEEYYGYLAILSMLNFLTTLDIKWIYSDQCREFGETVFTAALVYDWCYDLLTDDDKRRFTLGVEHILCRGVTEEPSKAPPGGAKMEIGFPPAGQGCVSGHGSEMQLLRDYVSYGLAIYDEHPGWWNYIGARFEYEYVPVRRVFYEAGMYPQGMCCYGPLRYHCDLWSAWLVKTSCGRLPYDEGKMAGVVRSMLANETIDGYQFLSGDSILPRLSANVATCALFSSHLFHDATARAAAFYIAENGGESWSLNPLYLLLASADDVEIARDRHKGIALIHKNQGYLNQFIARTGWDKNAAAILMKGGGRYPANHEHCNAGSFQIWYGSELSGDTGLYCGYGSPHHAFFHIMSIAHNTLLVYNPAYHDAELTLDERGRATNAARYWYSGGQKRLGEARNLDMWMDDSYKTANETLMQSKSDGEKPLYAYIASDITPAYEADTARFVRRSMLTSFETNGETPLVFFVFDRVESVDPSFRKTFLLQIPGEEAPIIDGNRITVMRNGAVLSVSSMLDGRIEGLGGIGQNHLVNGVQLKTPPGRMIAAEWGRIEVTPPADNGTAHFLHVMTVGDENTVAPTVEKISGKGLAGAYAAGTAAVFRMDRGASDEPLCFTLPSDAKLYVAGLSEGLWQITRNGKFETAVKVSAGKDMATLRLAAGEIEITKA